MHGVFEERVAEARKNEGRLLSGEDRLVPLPNWVDFARRCWPHKTAAHLAAIGRCDEHTAKRWLSGEYEPPQAVALVLINKLFERG